MRTDEQLLEATAAGDEGAFVEVYRRYQERVFRFAYHMTGSPQVAEDVMHDSFASLLEAPHRFRPSAAGLGTYLCAAARNQNLKRLRQTRREVTYAEPSPHAIAKDGPLQSLLQEEMTAAVRQAILRLAPLHREVVILFDLEGLDLMSVAEIVAAEVGTVKVRLHRARKKLRYLLSPYVTSGGAVLAPAERRR